MRAHSRSFAIATIALLLAACSSAPRNGIVVSQRLDVPPCPNFELRDAGNFSFDVTSAGDTVDLGDGSRLIFAPGAVTEPTRYAVRYLLKNGTSGPRVAGIDIERLSGYDGPFPEPVTLRLSYNKCGFTNSGRFYIVRMTSGGTTSEGGSNSASSEWVEAMLGEFSGFAIAM